MPKTVISNNKGVNVQGGSGTTIKNAATFEDTVTLDTTPVATIQAKTAAATITRPGVYTASGSSAFDLTMPLASAVPGGFFTLRTLSAHAHGLTGSAETGGTLVFIATGTVDTAAQGSKIAVEATVGASVTIYSDGRRFNTLAHSGTVAYSGT